MTAQDDLKRFALTPTQQLLLLLCNAIQGVHALLLVALVALPWAPLPWRIIAAVAALYLLPPLLVRLSSRALPLREGRIPVGDPAYMTWWLLINLQMIFNRLPWLEELLRLFPALYSNWLRLYGSRIGRFTYWAAGTRILDRSMLEIGDGVILGAGTQLAPHLVVRNDEGIVELALGRVIIGDGAVIGGFSALAAGTIITAGEHTRAYLLSPPFTTWKGGKRIDKDNLTSRHQAAAAGDEA
jgi:hypothetical protein